MATSNTKHSIPNKIRMLKNKVYCTQSKVTTKEKTVQVLLDKTKELKDLHEEEVYACTKLKNH